MTDYQQRAGDYDGSERNRRFYRHWAQTCVADLSALSEARVLELGCGSGISTEVFAETLGSRSYCGIDACGAMLDLARAKPALSGVTFEESPAEALPLGDASVDLVLSSFAFHWFQPEAALREIARVLAPGGRVRLLIPSLVKGHCPEAGNGLLRRQFVRAVRSGKTSPNRSIGLSLEAVVAPATAAGLEVALERSVERVEDFDSESEFWWTLESRGSLEAIFGPDFAPPTAASAPAAPLSLRWRGIVVELLPKIAKP